MPFGSKSGGGGKHVDTSKIGKGGRGAKGKTSARGAHAKPGRQGSGRNADKRDGYTDKNGGSDFFGNAGE